jgi:Flp pilus assembly protein TadD
MQSLEHPENHYLLAALGWVELGLPAEARDELEKIGAAQQLHPDVLEVRWLICAEEEQWAEGLQIARQLLHAAPERASAWLHQAYALRRTPDGGLQQAWDALLPAFDKFPEESTIAYNLACYACLLKQTEPAREWLKRALAIGGRERLRAMALADPDLEMLWPEIRDL